MESTRKPPSRHAVRCWMIESLDMVMMAWPEKQSAMDMQSLEINNPKNRHSLIDMDKHGRRNKVGHSISTDMQQLPDATKLSAETTVEIPKPVLEPENG